jgi:hypothetical protein
MMHRFAIRLAVRPGGRPRLQIIVFVICRVVAKLRKR